MASLSKSALSNVNTVEFKNSNGATTTLTLNPPTPLDSPTVGVVPLTYGDEGMSYTFAKLPSNCTYRGMTLRTPVPYTDLPTSATESDSVAAGGYKVIALGSWGMVGGWVRFAAVADVPKTYQFSFSLPTSLVFSTNPSICIQEQDGMGSYSGSENYLNTTYASCDYSDNVLTIHITKYNTEAGTLVFFVVGGIQ